MKICYLTKKEYEKIELYRGNKETVLYHYNEPEPGLFIAEGPTVFNIALANGYKTLSVLCSEKMLKSELLKGLDDDVTVYVVDKKEVEEYLGYVFAGEISALMCRKKEAALTELINSIADTDGGSGRILVLERVENPINVGALFRTAAAMNFDAVLLSPGCADPLYRRAIRVATGNTMQMKWSYITEKEWQGKGIGLLKEMGYTTVALALRSDNVDIEDHRLKECPKLAVIMGNEGHGLSEKTIADCDYVARIAMRPGVDSLNVGAAAAIAMYVLGRR